MGVPLYTLAADYQRIYDQAVDGETGEVTEDGDLLAQLDGIGDAIALKVENVCRIRAALLADAAGIKEEEQRLAARRKLREAAADRMREYIGACLRVSGQRQIKGALFTVRLQKNGQPRLVITDPDALPAAFTRVEVKPNTEKIKAALAAGEEVPGAELDTTGEHVRIS